MTPIELLLSRRSVVADNLAPPGPGEDELERILVAGLRVPDHGKVEPWRIQVPTPAGREALAELVAKLYRKDNPDASKKALKKERRRLLRGPTLLIVTSHPNPRKYKKVPRIEQELSGAAVCMNLLNAAHALGYAGQWLTGWPAYHPKLIEALGHGPDVKILGFIHLGTAAEEPRDRPRPELGEIVSSWRAPLAEVQEHS